MPVEVVEKVDDVVGSMSEVESTDQVEYAFIEGAKGKKLRIGSLSAGDLIEWSEANEGEAKRTAGLRLISKSLVGPEPDNIRYAADPKNIATFRKMSHKLTERIVREILKLNGMKVEQDAAAKKD